MQNCTELFRVVQNYMIFSCLEIIKYIENGSLGRNRISRSALTSQYSRLSPDPVTKLGLRFFLQLVKNHDLEVFRVVQSYGFLYRITVMGLQIASSDD